MKQLIAKQNPVFTFSYDKNKTVDGTIDYVINAGNNRPSDELNKISAKVGDIVQVFWKGKIIYYTKTNAYTWAKLLLLDGAKNPALSSYKKAISKIPSSASLRGEMARIYKALVEAKRQAKYKHADQNYYKREIERLEAALMAGVRSTQNGKLVKANAPSENLIWQNHVDQTLSQHNAMFAGRIEGKNRKVYASNYAPYAVAENGKLHSIELKNGSIISFGKDAFLGMDIRKNLWITGKDTRLTNLKMSAPNGLKDLVDLGKIKEIRYIKAKNHLEKGKLVEWFHEAGEITNERPHLFVENPSGELHIYGGHYDVWTDGIVN